MAVPTQSFSTIVSNAVTAIQGAATTLVDTTVGSILRAVTEAYAFVALWLQGIALQIAALTRFSTSSGPDADSWAADFGFYRLPPKPSSGSETFARFTPTLQVQIQAATQNGIDTNGNAIWTGGAEVQTSDGSETYMVIPDTTQSAYNASINAYVIPVNIPSCTATIVATTAGTASNVSAGQINTISQAIAGIDTVTNASPLTNGADAESDASFRARFVVYLQTLERGTPASIINAVESLQQGAYCTLTQNQDYNGTRDLGYFYLVVDDGTGSPSSEFLSTAYNAVLAVIPVDVTFGVFAPVIVDANVIMNLTLASGANPTTVVAQVTTALQTYIDSLVVEESLAFSYLGTLAYNTSTSITNVSGVTLNGSTADLTVTNKQVIKVGTISITTS